MFRYHGCSFNISEGKMATARAVLFNSFKIPYVFTIESSTGLYHDPEQMKTLHFTEDLWIEAGSRIAQGIKDFFVENEEYEQMLKEKQNKRSENPEKNKSTSPTKNGMSEFKNDKFLMKYYEIIAKEEKNKKDNNKS